MFDRFGPAYPRIMPLKGKNKQKPVQFEIFLKRSLHEA
jgi:hypothetical protein